MRALAHGWLDPADVYVNDPIVATLRLREGQHAAVAAKVQRISPLGLDVVVDAAAFTLGVVNCEIAVRLTLAGQKLDLVTVVVGRSATVAGQVQLALRIESETHRRARAQNVRGAKDATADVKAGVSPSRLWDCSTEFFPTALALNPARYNDYIYFKVLAVSAGGMRLACSQRNMMLLPGLKLKLQVSLPMVGEVAFAVRIGRVTASAEDESRMFDV